MMMMMMMMMGTPTQGNVHHLSASLLNNGRPTCSFYSSRIITFVGAKREEENQKQMDVSYCCWNLVSYFNLYYVIFVFVSLVS